MKGTKIRLVWLLAVTLLAGVAACGDEGAEPAAQDNNGNGGKADDASNPFLQALDGRQDALGKWLRDRSGVSDEGIFEADYVRIVMEVAEQEGCSIESVQTFLISDGLITGESPFPRTVTSICASDESRASEIFLSAPQATESGEIDMLTIEMFAWDDAERRYRFYRLDRLEEGGREVKVTIDPPQCSQCHLGAQGMDQTFIHMGPIMNELTLPWPHWNSEPDAENHSFELTDEIKSTESYNSSVAPWLNTAPNLEQIIRNGFARVNTARLRTRRDKPASPAMAMSLLRPLFCNERINFVTENGGTLSTSAYLDEGFINMYKTLGGGVWPWGWYNDRTIRVGDLVNEADQIDMVAVRGMMDIDYEQRLVSVRGLSAEQVLQVKALDWKRPVFSQFRCQLWNDANERVRLTPPEFAADARTSDLLPILFDEIMSIPGPDGQRMKLAAAEGRFVALDLADEATVDGLAEALATGALGAATCQEDGAGFCEVDLTGLGELLNGYIKRSEEDPGLRDKLLRERQERACVALELYPNSPDIPGAQCDGAGE